ESETVGALYGHDVQFLINVRCARTEILRFDDQLLNERLGLAFGGEESPHPFVAGVVISCYRPSQLWMMTIRHNTDTISEAASHGLKLSINALSVNDFVNRASIRSAYEKADFSVVY